MKLKWHYCPQCARRLFHSGDGGTLRCDTCDYNLPEAVLSLDVQSTMPGQSSMNRVMENMLNGLNPKEREILVKRFAGKEELLRDALPEDQLANWPFVLPDPTKLR